MHGSTTPAGPSSSNWITPGRLALVLAVAMLIGAVTGCRPVGMVGEPTLDPKTSVEFPAGGATPARLVDVRAAAHVGFDRVVLELADADAISWSVRYVGPPIRQRGSGDEVAVEGAAFLEVVLTPASAFLAPSGPGDTTVAPSYLGPDRLEVEGGVVTEIVSTGENEQTLSWVIGLEQRRPFAAAQYESPTRIVIDVLAP